jgi:hypothetical protein
MRAADGPLHSRHAAVRPPARRSLSGRRALAPPRLLRRLSGGLEVGGFHRIGSGPSEGKWSWGAGIGSGTATFTAGGYAIYPDVCRTLIGSAFRRMLARADLRERPDAKPGPPRRASAEGTGSTSGPTPPYEREKDRLLGPMVRNEMRRTIRSGELVVGLLARSTHGPDRWWWSFGLTRPDDEDFEWCGEAASDDEAFDALAACWSRWLEWAGLEPLAPLQRGARR